MWLSRADQAKTTFWICGGSWRQPTFADVHCHCLPRFDDGPADNAQALALCQALVADHTGTVLATPHQLGRFDGRYDGRRVRLAVEHLNGLLAEAGLPLTVLAGADVRLDERIGELLYMDEILTVADGGRYLLLELPDEVFVDPGILLSQLGEMGIRAIISHPERHVFLAQNPGYVRRWLEYQPCLQITAGSLLGDFGVLAQRAAWVFLKECLPVLVATDAHDTGRRAPRMTAAYTRLMQHLGRPMADVLCVENPRRLLAGDDLLTLDENMVRKEVNR